MYTRIHLDFHTGCLSGIIDDRSREYHPNAKEVRLSHTLLRKLGNRCAPVHVGLVLLVLLGCDPDGRKECAWTLEPEPKLKGTTTEGFIPVCARNRKSMKEDCRFQATLAFAEGAWGRKFRYTDIRVRPRGYPREIESIRYCDSKS